APAILTPATATVDELGGIVATNPPKNGWELAQSTTAKQLELRNVAPGLVVIPLPTNGMFELRDSKHAVLASVTRGPTKVTPLPAPKPRLVRRTAPKSRGDDSTITAMFAAKPPAGAVALIVFAKGKPRSWGRVTAGSTSVVVYRGACQTTPPAGTISSRIGETITLAWLDETGHVSAPSRAVKVR
ncbi:MAG TPA: hypothetical protein VIV11_00260, partial [Kofleriaceae bacterium]